MTTKAGIAVLGAGSWGTALAIHLCQNNKDVRLWGRNRDQMHDMQAARQNASYLPDINFPDNLTLHDDLEQTLAGVADVVLAVPSQALRSLLKKIKELLQPGQGFCIAAKGLDPSNLEFLHSVVTEELGASYPCAVLSGPSFAKEVARNLPTAICLATNDNEYGVKLLARFHSQHFRVYLNDDVTGVELGGVVKNVLAIAAGIADGLEYGANARAALITRGLAEMMRLGTALGAEHDTLMGLSGLGDLLLTATDNQSRNRRFGLAIGQGLSVDQALRSIGQVVEGVHNVEQVYQLAQKHNIEMPITEQVYAVVKNHQPPQEVIEHLFARAPKME